MTNMDVTRDGTRSFMVLVGEVIMVDQLGLMEMTKLKEKKEEEKGKGELDICPPLWHQRQSAPTVIRLSSTSRTSGYRRPVLASAPYTSAIQVTQHDESGNIIDRPIKVTLPVVLKLNAARHKDGTFRSRSRLTEAAPLVPENNCPGRPIPAAQTSLATRSHQVRHAVSPYVASIRSIDVATPYIRNRKNEHLPPKPRKTRLQQHTRNIIITCWQIRLKRQASSIVVSFRPADHRRLSVHRSL
ncbi:hypothetical protein ACRALDRAFT_1093241 [Sodiomyces alcalophilus JCM 7366]|uniref:uncharacterized protein n=1 Tax=Sodiomyces alcalophilus JCM 7366 TaxID=591952 RepID=UPI0039B61C63